MIHTVTVNPALDLTYRVAEVKLDDTTRARQVLRAAGGKGVNVSRVAARLGHPTVAMGFVGGRPGEEVAELLRAEGVRTWFTRFEGMTRTNAIVQDDAGRQIRVSAPGPEVGDTEVASLLEGIFDLRAPDFLVLSGSLLRGMPRDFYVTLTTRAAAEGVQVMADADGEELAASVRAGAFVIKPNHYELGRLVGRAVEGPHDAVEASRPLLAARPAAGGEVGGFLADGVGRGVEAVLCSLGPQGAVLTTAEGAWLATPPEVRVDSAVGAGDSMVAGALVAAADGAPWPEVLRLGVACGTATATTPGTELCQRATVEELRPRVRVERLT